MSSYAIVGWVATLLCVLIPIRCAQAFHKHNFRLFNALGLIALAWSLLLPYYGNVAQSELFVAFAGFALVHSGALVRREARVRQNEAEDVMVRRTDALALWLLPFLAAPAAITLPTGVDLSLSVFQAEMLIACGMYILGFISVTIGVKRLCGSWPTVVIGIVSLFYVICAVSFVLYRFEMKPGQPLLPFFYIAFAAGKLCFTLSFCYVITVAGLSDSDRSLPVLDRWIKVLIG